MNYIKQKFFVGSSFNMGINTASGGNISATVLEWICHCRQSRK